MTYDFSVFSRGNYYKDSLYFKNTKGFRLYLLLIFRYIAKKTFHAASERTTRAAYSLASTQIKASAEASVRNRPPGAPSARQKKFRPGNRDGRSFKAGWRIASAGVINRHRFRCCKITLRLFHRCDSPVTIPGIWHCTHVAAAGKAARPHHPATKAACPDCKRPGRPCRITGSATIAIRRRPASHSGRAGIIPYSHSMVAGGFEEMS